MKVKKIFYLSVMTISLICCSACGPKVIQSSDEGATVDQLLKLNGREKLVAVLETNFGSIDLELFARETPVTVKNFVTLSVQGYYNGLIFHRIMKDFMIQGGDPLGTGEGGESIYGKTFEDEIVPNFHFDEAGMLAMANGGPNTNGSQFFITTVPTPFLDRKHTIFGKVVGGMNNVMEISKLRVNSNERPMQKVEIKKVIIEKRAG